MSSNKKVQLIFEWEIVYVYILPAAHRKVVSLNKKELLNLSSGDSIKQYSLLDRVNVLLLSSPRRIQTRPDRAGLMLSHPQNGIL